MDDFEVYYAALRLGTTARSAGTLPATAAVVDSLNHLVDEAKQSRPGHPIVADLAKLHVGRFCEVAEIADRIVLAFSDIHASKDAAPTIV